MESGENEKNENGLSCAQVTLVSIAVSKCVYYAMTHTFDTCIVIYNKIHVIHRSLLFNDPFFAKKFKNSSRTSSSARSTNGRF